jgi:hypothetical protein
MDGYLVKKLIERIQIGYRDLGGWMDGHGRRLQVGPRSTEPVNRPLAAQVTVPGARSPHQRRLHPLRRAKQQARTVPWLGRVKLMAQAPASAYGIRRDLEDVNWEIGGLPFQPSNEVTRGIALSRIRRVYGAYTARIRRADGDAFEVTSPTAVADASVMAPIEQ